MRYPDRPHGMCRDRIFIELMTSDRKLKASREGSKSACTRADVHLAGEGETGSASAGSADHSQLDMLGVWYKSANVDSQLGLLGVWYKSAGWGKSSVSPHWLYQTD